MKAEKLLETALELTLIDLTEAQVVADTARAYLRKSVELHNLETANGMPGMDLGLYDEVDQHIKSVLGNPLPKLAMRICPKCWTPAYLGDNGEEVHYSCLQRPTSYTIESHWAGVMKEWIEEARG